MKKEIVRIANELKLGEITTKEAKEELLSLFGVSGSLLCSRCETDINTHVKYCTKCDSEDILPDHYLGDKCLDCGSRDLDYR